ncbi:MAG: SRPBCC family protein [Sphingomicrobium sp.]
MTEVATREEFGVLTEPGTLTIRRILPGPIERIWAYLTDSDKRRQWLAAGVMDMRVGAPFELVWNNSELTDPPGELPQGHDGKHQMVSEITELDPPRKLAFSWGATGGVTFELDPRGDDVLLTLTHRRIADPAMRLNISAGWHAHLDVLAAKVRGEQTKPFWDHWAALKQEYQQRLSA